MLKAKNFKFYAREALKGRWLNAGGASLIAALLGASIGYNMSITSFGGGTGESFDSEMLGLNPAVTDSISEVSGILLTIFLGIVLVAFVWGIIMMIIGGATTIGYAKYSLNLVDHREAKIKDVVSEYDRLGTGFAMQFFRGLYTFLWSLLFVIPGVIATLQYYMTPFVLAENPEMEARDAMRKSKELMKGNEWRLFCLNFSFIGWGFLAAFAMVCVLGMAILPAALTGGDEVAVLIIMTVAVIVTMVVFAIVCMLTLAPYMQTSWAVFYREIKDGKYSKPQVEGFAEEYSWEAVNEEKYYEMVDEK